VLSNGFAEGGRGDQRPAGPDAADLTRAGSVGYRASTPRISASGSRSAAHLCPLVVAISLTAHRTGSARGQVSLRLRIFPVAVIGRVGTNSSRRGYL
jgi:hypothetical protein